VVDALPGAEAFGQRRPGAPSSFHPAHAGHYPPMVNLRPPAWRLQRGEERAYPLPGVLRQRGAARRSLRGSHAGQRHGQETPRPPCLVAAPGGGLLAPSPAGPVQTEAEALRRLGQRQQQAAHLGHRQRDQLVCGSWSPCLPASCTAAAAWTRVTSR
jgi:hypothetical protein